MEVDVGGEGESDGGGKVGLNNLGHLYSKMTRMVGWMRPQKSCQHHRGNRLVARPCSQACHCLGSAGFRAKIVWVEHEVRLSLRNNGVITHFSKRGKVLCCEYYA